MATHAHATTKICRVLIGLAVMWGIIGLSGVGSWASDNKYDRATLRGLPGIMVAVEPLESAVERGGLTTRQLQTAVELQLRKAGIRVFTEEEGREIPGQPYLYVNVGVLLHSDGLVAYIIRVELNQQAFLKTDASSAMVATWSRARLATVGIETLYHSHRCRRHHRWLHQRLSQR